MNRVADVILDAGVQRDILGLPHHQQRPALFLSAGLTIVAVAGGGDREMGVNSDLGR